jgi:hypothetical protein
MNIKEIIINEAGGFKPSSPPPRDSDSPSAFKQAADTVGGFVKDVGNDMYDTGKLVYDAGKDVGTTIGNAISDPKQAAQDLSKWKDKQGEKINWALDNPGQAAKAVVQTAKDSARATSNAATLGLATPAYAGLKSAIKGTPFKDEWQKQDDANQEAFKRSPISSTVGTIGGTFIDPVFMAGAKAGKAIVNPLLKSIPKSTTLAGKAKRAVPTFAASQTTGFAADRAGYNAANAGQEKAAKELYAPEKEINELQKLAGRPVSEGDPHIEGGGIHAPRRFTPMADIGNLDPNARTAQGRNPSASYQERVRAAQQQKDAAKASGPVDPKHINDPERAAQQKQIQALSDKMAAQEKAASDAKTRSRAMKIAAGTALVGGSLYLKDKLKPETKWDDPSEDPFMQKYKADQAAAKTSDKQETPAINTTSTPQSTDTDNGNMFSKETFKTNESSSELNRIRDLIGYRK